MSTTSMIDPEMIEVTDPEEIASITEDRWLHGPDHANQINGLEYQGKYYAWAYSVERFRKVRS